MRKCVSFPLLPGGGSNWGLAGRGVIAIYWCLIYPRGKTRIERGADSRRLFWPSVLHKLSLIRWKWNQLVVWEMIFNSIWWQEKVKWLGRSRLPEGQRMGWVVTLFVCFKEIAILVVSDGYLTWKVILWNLMHFTI